MLELDGSFEELDFSSLATSGKPVAIPVRLPRSVPILLGATSQGQLISLVDCQVLSGSPSFLQSRGSLKVWPEVLVYGVHFASSDDFRLTSLSVRYSHLDTWVATSGFSVNLGTAFYPIEVRYAKPEPIESDLSEGFKLRVDFSAFGPTIPVNANLQITQRSWLTIASTVDVPFKRLLENITDFANLISLAVGEPLRPLELSAKCNAQDPSGVAVSVTIELVHNRKPIAPSSSEVPHWEMLFTLPDVRARFSELMTAWHRRNDALRTLGALYFGTVRSPAMYVEHRFFSMFQAVESYDRRAFQLSAEKLLAHNERKERILKSVETTDRTWLTQKLQYSHEPRAADRLKHIVETLGAGWLLSEKDIELSVKMRNYYTHFDPKSEEQLPPLGERFLIMHNLAVRLRTLCELVLLDAVGFSMENVQERIRSTRRIEGRLVKIEAE